MIPIVSKYPDKSSCEPENNQATSLPTCPSKTELVVANSSLFKMNLIPPTKIQPSLPVTSTLQTSFPLISNSLSRPFTSTTQRPPSPLTPDALSRPLTSCTQRTPSPQPTDPLSRPPTSTTRRPPSPQLKDSLSRPLTSTTRRTPSPQKLSPLLRSFYPTDIKEQINFIETFLASADNRTKFNYFSSLKLPNQEKVNITDITLKNFFNECNLIASKIWKILSPEEKTLFFSCNHNQFSSCLCEFIAILDFGIKYQIPFIEKILSSFEDRTIFSKYAFINLPLQYDQSPLQFHKIFFDACEDILFAIQDALKISTPNTSTVDLNNPIFRRDPDAFISLLRQHQNLHIIIKDPYLY